MYASLSKITIQYINLQQLIDVAYDGRVLSEYVLSSMDM
jgi:hypothetical protein